MKPIHKYNGGQGATLCHICNKIISVGLTNDLYCNKHGGKQYKYELKKLNSTLVLNAHTVYWIKWGEDGRAKQKYKQPKVGYSLILDPTAFGNFTWLTTEVTEILKKKPGYIEFKTKNSTYKLTWEI